MNCTDEFEMVLRRIASRLNGFCSSTSLKIVKVCELFVEDTVAITVLSKLLSNQSIRNDVLENTCHIRFQGKGKWREVMLNPTSRIEASHLEMMMKLKNKAKSTNTGNKAEVVTNVKRKKLQSALFHVGSLWLLSN